ncbi:MAG TPA: hypothetical protein VMV72_11795 [Verrucomicrobiae bacterium]|nr:hypothetical protein [Verrucomicrobiae bacterium]
MLTAASSLRAAESPSNSVQRIVADAFAQASLDHSTIKTAGLYQARRADTPPIELRPWSFVLGFDDKSLNRSDALEDLIKRITALTPSNSSDCVASYCQFAKRFLSDDRAGYRAIACEFLGHFPTEMAEQGSIPQVGNLLDDDALAFKGMHETPVQSGLFTCREVGIGVTVGDIARAALEASTGIRFSNREKFLAWWGNNAAFQERIWYWAVRWRIPDPSDDLGLLEKIEPRQALKVMLLVDNGSALLAESGVPPSDLSSWMCHSPNKEAIAEFVRRNNLRQTLLDLLSGSAVWPELQIDQYSRMDFVNKVSELSTGVFEQADAKTLEGILDSGGGLVAQEPRQQATIALLAAHLDPERYDEIVISRLKRNPEQAALAVDAVQRTGMEHWELIKTAFARSRVYEQATIIDALGTLKDSTPRKALGELMESQDFTAHLDQRGWPNRNDTERLLRAYVGAAQALNHGQPVVDNDLLDKACFTRPFKVEYDEVMKQHDANVPAARSQALEELRQFFSQ